MATRIRLQRHGKKNQPFYHIVVADGRAPRDGRYIERLGTYNPLTNPAEVKINFDRALYWVETGAAPSDTVRSILKREGVYLMKHLRGGIAKGALTEADANKKFVAWEQDKTSKINNLKRELADNARTELKKRMEAETKVKEAVSAKVAAKYAAEAKAAADAQAEAAAEVEAAAAAETPAETDAPAAEENAENTSVE
ncbi:MAG TPA: 30S ribosomal protein S16 [Bacteroidales bacterium]|nr:30S ribosomal protein S16 [Bacteroidales bacterium]